MALEPQGALAAPDRRPSSWSRMSASPADAESTADDAPARVLRTMIPWPTPEGTVVPPVNSAPTSAALASADGGGS